MIALLWDLRDAEDFRTSGDNDMHRRLRRDIPKGHNVLVFVDDIARNLPVDDLCEQGSHIQFNPVGYALRVDNENDAIWAEMPEGGLLRDLFGYWPSFHESELKSIHFDPANDRLNVAIDYIDEVTERDSGLMALVELVFTGIRSVDLELRANDIMDLRFKRLKDGIESRIEFCDGSAGRIVSDSVDASIRSLDPLPDDSTQGLIRLTYGRRI